LQQGPLAYVLTARHLVEGAEALELSFYSARTFPKPGPVVRDVEVLASSTEADLALLRATVRVPLSAGLRLAAEAPAEMPFPALSVGCSDGLVPTLLLESVQSARRVRKPGMNEAVLMWELVREPASGRSGGPLLDRQGRLIGMTSGRSSGKGYCIHLDEIRRFLKRHHFDELLTEKSQP
jgi:S1-C subfamily serine protease